MTCRLCGGNAGHLIEGAHAMCSALRSVGLPTPNLGMRCEVCNGAGTTGRGGVALFLDIGPSAIARSIRAQFPPCAACDGRGYTVPAAGVSELVDDRDLDLDLIRLGSDFS